MASMYSHTAPSAPAAVQRYRESLMHAQEVPLNVAVPEVQSRAQASPQKQSGRGKARIVAASLVLTLFTVFVLLDTFAFERVLAQVDNTEAAYTAFQAAEEKTSSSTETRQTTAASAETANASVATDQAGASFYSVHKASVDETPVVETASEEAVDAATATSGESEADTALLAENDDEAANETTAASTSAAASDSGLSYADENTQISISTLRVNDTDVYVADVQVSSAEYLKTALAQNAYGRNLKDTTSNMASSAGAILAINGDYYGFRDEGYVVRNGVLYRDVAAAGTDALVVYADGSMESVDQSSVSAQELVDAGAWQVFSFGPTLVDNGQIAVGEGTEVGQSMNSNPRTAIGMIDPLHYVLVVSGGRSGDNAGLSLYELAEVMQQAGATYAYNLDGGGSSTIWFQGEVLNDPSSGHRDGERSVSDIVYIG